MFRGTPAHRSIRRGAAACAALALVGVLAWPPGAAVRAEDRADGDRAACLRTLDRLDVEYRPVRRRGIAIAVEVTGAVGGVEYRGYRDRPLVLDCSLVASLAHAGRFLAEHGVERATYSSAYQRRKVRGSDRWSNHSYGLAIDVHVLAGEALGTLRVKDDYEQGLGDDVDCVGRPLTAPGAVLRTVICQFERSGAFRMILTPDSDASHYNHFHLEVSPWRERDDLPME